MAASISSLTTSSFGSATLSTIRINANTVTAFTLSTLQLNVSSINGGTVTTTSDLVSTTGGVTRGYATAGFISSPNLLSTTGGLQREFITAGFLSSPNLLSTTGGLQREFATAGFLSTASLISTTAGLVEVPELISTTGGLQREFGTAGFLSSLNLLSTTGGLQREFNTAGFLSTASLVSTTAGIQRNVTALNVSAGSITTSSFTTFTANISTTATISSLIVNSLQFGDGTGWVNIGPLQTVALSTFQVDTNLLTSFTASTFALNASSVNGGRTINFDTLQSTTRGLETFVSSFIDPNELLSTITSTVIGIGIGSNLTSTVAGLGTAGYVSSLSLLSTTSGLTSTITSTLISTVGGVTRGYATAGFLSSLNLLSTTGGLQREFNTAGFLSTANLVSTTAGLIEVPELISTTRGLQDSLVSSTAGVIEVPELISTTGGITRGYLTAGYLSTLSLISTTAGLESLIVSTTGGVIELPELVSTTGGITRGYLTAGYLSTLSLISTTTGLQTNLVSTTGGIERGYLTAGYLSTLSLISTTRGLQDSLVSTTGGLVELPELVSTTGGITRGYLTAGYLSTLSLISTTRGLQDSLVSTTAGVIEVPELVSTTEGITRGYLTAGYLSTLSLISTTRGLQDSLVSTTGGLVELPELVSTTGGLQREFGTAGFLSSPNLLSTTGGLQRQIATSDFISSLNLLSTTGGIQREFRTAGFLSSPNLISTVDGLLLRESISTGQGVFSTVFINMSPETAPFWDFKTYPTLGFDPQPEPLALDVFGSARILKNLYIGSTTTVIGTGGIVAPIVSTQITIASRISTTTLISFDSVFNQLTIPFSSFSTTSTFLMKTSSYQIGFGGFASTGQVYFGDFYSANGFSSLSSPFMIIEQKPIVTPGTTTFSYTGATQTFTVPMGVTEIGVLLRGAGGGSTLNSGGAGGLVAGTLRVSPGETLTMIVGQGGSNGGARTFGGGGAGLVNPDNGSSGGGRSAIQRGGLDIVVAGGGGGSGGNSGTVNSLTGGLGGGLTGGNGGTGGGTQFVGKGGTQSAGGAGGVTGSFSAQAGSLGQGGDGLNLSSNGGGGGGGGYYGGGGGAAFSAGGGGSSYIANLTGSVANVQGGGASAGQNGSMVLVYNALTARPGNILEFVNYESRKILVDQFLNMGIRVNSINQSYALDVSGTGRFSSLVTENINFGPSYVTSTIAGSVAGNVTGFTIPYSTLGTVSTYNIKTSSIQTYFGTFGSSAQLYIGDILSFTGNSTASTPIVRLEQTPVNQGLAIPYSYTGANQTFVVPSNVTRIRVSLNGAGGGGPKGGAGGLVSGILPVTPGETLTVIVGQGGELFGANTYGGGGAGGDSASGGGRSAIQRAGADIVTAGGGGGFSQYNNPSFPTYRGGNGGGSTGEDGQADNNYNGKGGTQSAGGAGGPSSGSGSLGTGGNGFFGGGGGGGYYGGGGGTINNFSSGTQGGGGGGGSSFVANLSGTVVNTQGAGAALGINGSVTIIYDILVPRPGNLLQITNFSGSNLIVDPYLNMGINVSSINPSFQLDVNGITRLSSLMIENSTFTPSYVNNLINNLFIPFSSVTNPNIFQFKASSTQLFFGGTPLPANSSAQVYIGDIYGELSNTTRSTPMVVLEQQPVPVAGSMTFIYTGGDQTYTVPAGVTSLSVTLRGAGGGPNAGGASGSGGAGGLVSGRLAVTPGETLTLVVGQAGRQDTPGGTYGGGASGGTQQSQYGGSGGGRTAIRRAGNDIVVAGGGGGSSRIDPSFGGGVGGAGGGLTGGTGAGSLGGFGGSQSAGGGKGGSAGVDGSLINGGQGGTGGGGGGGGYYGGGGAGGSLGGGGGGSSYVDNLIGTVVNTQGGGAASASNGSMLLSFEILTYRPGNLLEVINYQGNKLIVDPFLNVGINVSSTNTAFNLDVNGAARALSFSTVALNVSSINGQTPGGLTANQLISTTRGLGSAGYLSSFNAFSMSTGFLTASSINMIDTNLGTQQFLTVSSGFLQLNGSAITGGGAATPTDLVSTTGGLQREFRTAGFLSSPNLLSTTGGLQREFLTAGFLSSPNLLSTTAGLQSSLISTTRGLETYISSFIDPTELRSTIVSTVIGVGQASNFTSTVAGLGTSGYVSSASLFSSLNNLLIPYSTFNTNTVFLARASSTQFYFGAYGSTSQLYIGDALSRLGNSVITSPLVLMEQLPLTLPLSGNNAFSYTGSDQTFVVPAGVTSVNVTLSGAGGGGTSNFGLGNGGTGGYVSGTLAVTPGETLTIVVGQAGIGGGLGNTYGGGGRSSNTSLGASGGGRSALRRAGADIVTAGGGGGGGYNFSVARNGGVGGGLTGGDGIGAANTFGKGGTQVAGGAGGTGTTNGVNGSLGAGGNGGSLGGGGGGGYYGGGGGASGDTGDNGAGAGGSSFVANLTGTVVNTQGGGGAGGIAGGNSGGGNGAGTNGSITISFNLDFTGRPGNMLEMRAFNRSRLIVDPTLRTGINVSTINSNYYLDVSGATNVRSLFINTTPFVNILTSTTTSLGSLGYVSTSQLTSSLNALSTINNLLVPYSTLSTSTYFNLKATSTQMYFGTYGSTAQLYIGDLQAKNKNSTFTYPLLLIEQEMIHSQYQQTSAIVFTGSDQNFTVPNGVTSINVSLTGAGGGGLSSGSGNGGNGGLVSGTLAVTPGEVLTILVGQGGVGFTSTNPYGGGGRPSSSSIAGSGGGRSAIRRVGTELVTAGGGGGAGNGNSGGAGGGLTAAAGGGAGGGGGGTQLAGGAAGAGSPGGVAGSQFTGADANNANAAAGGGGGGWYGGGSGGSNSGGGGGGSSYVANLTGIVVNTQGGGGAGGTAGVTSGQGVNGSVTLVMTIPPGYRSGNMLEMIAFNRNRFIVDPFLRTGINVSTLNSNYSLDVGGTANFTDLAINTSSIGSLFASTVRGLGTAGYVSSAQAINLANISSFNVSTGQINTSTLTFVDINTQARQLLLVSSGTLTLNGQAIGGGAGGGSGLTISDYVAAGKLNANQTLASGDPNKVVEFATLFDPQNWYNETNYRFTPTIAGYYMVSFGVWFNEMSGGSSNQYNIQIEKNGGTQVGLAQNPTSVTAGTSLELTKIIYMNGSDYLRFTALQGTGVDLVIKPGIAATASATFFTAALLTNGSGGQNLLSTVANLGSAGYVSTLSLLSTTAGLQTNLISTTGGLIEVPELVSTTGGITRGYLTSGYLSTLSLISTTRGLQDNLVSSTAGVIELPELVSTTGGITTGYLTAGYLSTLSLISTTRGLQDNLVSSTAGVIELPELVSTTGGLQREFGTAGFISSLNLLSTTGGLQRGFGTAGFLSSPNLLSTTGGLQREFGTAGFLSSLNLLSTTGGLQREFGTAGFISTLSLISTTSGLQTSLFSTTAGLERYISSFIDPTELQSTITSTVIGVGQASNFISTTVGLGSAGYISSLSFASSLISTTNAFNLAISSFSTAFGPGGVSPLNLVSTTGGLQRQIATSDFISSPNLISTSGGLQRQFGTAGFLSSPNLLSTTGGLQREFGTAGFLSSLNLLSTTGGLQREFGTAGFLSSLNLVSTTGGLQREFGTAGFLSSLNLLSSVQGLGSIGYVSTQTLISTVTAAISSFSTAIGQGGIASIPANLSTFAFFTSSILASTTVTRILSTQQAFTSSMTGTNLQFVTLSSQALFVSSFFTATVTATPMFITF